MSEARVRILELAHARHPDDENAFRSCAAWMSTFARVPMDGCPECAAIIKATCQHFGVSVDEILGSQRAARLVIPRQLAMFICARYSGKSLPQIGRAFNRDHTTILYARNQVAERMIDDPGQADVVKFILEAVTSEQDNQVSETAA